MLVLFIFSTKTYVAGQNLLNRYTHSISYSMNLNFIFDKDQQSKNIDTQSQNLDNKEDNDQKISKVDRIIIFTAGHESLYRTAFNMFLDRPIIGQGPKMFRIKCKDPKFATGITPCHNHPHNFYMQLLAETGLVGFLSIFYIFIHLSFLFFKHAYSLIFFKKRIFLDYKICLMSGVFITLWPITTNGNFFTNNLMIYYGLQVGFFFANKEESQTQN